MQNWTNWKFAVCLSQRADQGGSELSAEIFGVKVLQMKLVKKGEGSEEKGGVDFVTLAKWNNAVNDETLKW